MKKLYFSTAFLLIAGSSFAQAFWSESFGTGCNRGQLASSYTGTNGAWTIVSTGTNGNVANNFYVSSTASNTGAGNCADNCIFNSVSDASLHVGNASIVIPSFYSANADTGASYFSGGLSTFGYVATSNVRAESPVINCSGRASIDISFIYLENGQGTSDDAALVYSADGGMTWSVINALAKTPTTCAAAGEWTALTVLLPASADNNANVKIGFTWTNNDDGQGSDPSFAVDDLVLNEYGLGIAGATAASVNLFVTNNNTLQVETAQQWNLVSVTNIMGQPLDATRNGNQVTLAQHAEGVYFVTLNVNDEQVIKKIYLQ